MPQWQSLSRTRHYINRTWEYYQYQSVLHDLCNSLACWAFECPSEKSLLSAKKWEKAREYANQLRKEIDAQNNCFKND